MSERLENSQNNKSEEFVGLSPAKKKPWSTKSRLRVLKSLTQGQLYWI